MTVAEIREQVRSGGLLETVRPLVAMLSGGRDSVCLLDVAVALRGAERVRALHVNYGLRPEAGEDELHCRELCEQLGVEIEVVHANRTDGATGNLHAWARELRYEAAISLAGRLDEQFAPRGEDERSLATQPDHGTRTGAEERTGKEERAEGPQQSVLVASGHTSDDQVETILYRLAASPGRRALLGMRAREHRLVRPLLGVSRDDTGAYCRERRLSWREDSSNDSERYARARVRHGLLPALEAVHPAARVNVLRTAVLLREETELLDALVEAELEGRSSIAVERLRELPPALARLVAIHLAERVAGTFVPQAGERVQEILALGARGGHAELHVGGLVGAVIEHGELRMVAIPPRAQR